MGLDSVIFNSRLGLNSVIFSTPDLGTKFGENNANEDSTRNLPIKKATHDTLKKLIFSSVVIIPRLSKNSYQGGQINFLISA